VGLSILLCFIGSKDKKTSPKYYSLWIKREIEKIQLKNLAGLAKNFSFAVKIISWRVL